MDLVQQNNSHPRHLIVSDKWKGYKVIISVLFGMLGLIAAFYAVQFGYHEVKINITLIFPLMTTMTWGKIFRFKRFRSAKYNSRIVLFVIAIVILFAFLIVIGNYHIIKYQYSIQWLFHLPEKVLVKTSHVFLSGLLIGGIYSGIYQWRLETEAVLKAGEDKFRNIFENTNDIYIEATLNGTIIYISPSVKNTLGYTSEDLIGTDIVDLYYEPDQQKQMIEAILQKKEVKNYEVSMKGKSGHKHYISFNIRIADYGNGEHRTISIARDVTDRKKAEEELKRANTNLEAIIESTDELIWLMDKDYRLIFCNSAYKKHIKKYFRADIEAGIRSEDIFSSDYAFRWNSLYERAKEYGRYTEEFVSPVSLRYFDISYYPIYEDGDLFAISCFAKDNTERKCVEYEIIELNYELEQRVAERTAALQAALSELETFVYSVSHDLKSPLRAIDAYSRIMLEDYPHIMEGEMGELAGNIRNISKDMIALISKLLQYSTAERLETLEESVDIYEMMSEIFNEFKSAVPERKIKLIIVTELPKVKADKILLKLVIYNIISNAVKFTKNREMAIIKVKHKISKEEIIFSVKDNGAGFDMEASGKLFGLFQRLHTAEEYEGTGIGLATVRKMIQKQGGRVWIEGKPDHGATVYFTLPVM